MSKSRLRKLAYLLFSLAVVTVGGFVALTLARGNTITAGGIKSTGTVRINISPNNKFTTFLNEQQQTLSSSNTIDNVLPGEYDLRIQKDGYNTWNQRIAVYAGLVTDISAQLFPGTLPPTQLTQSSVKSVVFSPSRKHAFYLVTDSQIGGNVGLWQQPVQPSNIPLVEEKPVKITNLVSSIQQYAKNGQLEIVPSPTDSKILLKTPLAVFVLDAGRYNEPSVDNTIPLSYAIDKVEWITGSNNLLLRSGELVIDYDLDKKTSNIITYKTGTKPVYAKANSVVFYVLGGALYKYTPGVNERVKLENVQLPKDPIALYPSQDNDRSLVLKTDDSIYFLDTNESSLTSLGNYQIVSIAPSARNLIVMADKQLRSIEVNVSLARDTVEVKQRSTALSDKINLDTIAWAPNSIYFVYLETDQTKVLAADKTGNNINPILSTNKISQIVGIPADNSGIIVTLRDGGIQEESRSNIYKLSLSQL